MSHDCSCSNVSFDLGASFLEQSVNISESSCNERPYDRRENCNCLKNNSHQLVQSTVLFSKNLDNTLIDNKVTKLRAIKFSYLSALHKLHIF